MKIKDICDLLEYDEFHPNEWIARKNQHKNEAIKDISNLEVKLTLDEEKIEKIMDNSWKEAFKNPKCLNRIDRFKIVAQVLKSKSGEIIKKEK